MPRTITISDEHYEDALRAVLWALNEQLERVVVPEIHELLGGANASPLETPQSHDVHSHLLRARRTFEALEALGWPDGAASEEGQS